jgi:hypothetical protein
MIKAVLILNVMLIKAVGAGFVESFSILIQQPTLNPPLHFFVLLTADC